MGLGAAQSVDARGREGGLSQAARVRDGNLRARDQRRVGDLGSACRADRRRHGKLALGVGRVLARVDPRWWERGSLLTRHAPRHRRSAEGAPRLPWRNGLAWRLGGVFGLMAVTYYGLNAWLPDAYVERGWSEGRAGALIAALNIASLVTTVLVPALADRVGSRRVYLVTLAACLVGVCRRARGGSRWSVALRRRDRDGVRRVVPARDGPPARRRTSAFRRRGCSRDDAAHRLSHRRRLRRSGSALRAT